MIEDFDIIQAARDGARAVADGDGGRSAHLLGEVEAAMTELSVGECEWLSIAVSNGAFSRQMGATPAEPTFVGTQQTPEGEIWDI